MTLQPVTKAAQFVERSSFLHEGLCLRYLVDLKRGITGLQLLPASRLDALVERREKAETQCGWNLDAWQLQPLVGLHLEDAPSPDGFTQGRTLQGSQSAASLMWDDQSVRRDPDRTQIVTRQRSPDGRLEVEHVLELRDGLAAARCHSRVRNVGDSPCRLQLLTSFSFGALTPFADDDAPGRLFLHRFRSSWSQEGRHVVDSFEHLHLEPSWTRAHLFSERFGQVGSMPVRGYFPLAVIEDREAAVFWAGQVAWPGSWQIEVLRRGEGGALAGGLADYELGHWQKTLAPGESFESPPGFITTSEFGLDDICDRLIEAQRRFAPPSPEVEQDLPIVFNEFCSSWGRPSEETLRAISEKLHHTPVRYIVADGGWTAGVAKDSIASVSGDWEPHPLRFPRSFGDLNAGLRGQGQIPGIWFEFEVATTGSKAHTAGLHFVRRNDRVLDVGERRFWDFRDPWVIEYLSERVIQFLRRNGFGYLKVDYNDTVGVGCDSPDGLGEGLRQHIAAVCDFLRRIRRELPELVVENCASGGHRLEPTMVGLTSMSSFSDAHEDREIPWIAANLQRLIPPEKSQIWAVLRSSDDEARLSYTLAAAFLGRMCLSGDLGALSTSQWSMAQEAMALYRRVWPIIRHGLSHRFGPAEQSVRRLKDHQMVVRALGDGTRALLTWHAFEGPDDRTIEAPLPAGSEWSVAETWPRGSNVERSAEGLRIRPVASFSGGVIVLEGRRP